LKIKFKAKSSANLVYDDEVVTISDIRITQTVSAMVPRKNDQGSIAYDQSGRAIMEKKTSTQSFNLEDIDVTKRNFTAAFRNLFLINSPDAELTLTFSISAEDEDEEEYEKENISVAFQPGDTIDIRMEEIFPELNK
jgi:hypothetical protein